MTDLPHNLSAEQALIGSLLYEGEAVLDLIDGLQPAHFFEPYHGRLYACALGLIRSGRSAAPNLIADRFRDDPAFDELGGVRYLANLVDEAPPGHLASDYARAIREAALRRFMIGAAKELETSASDHSADAADHIVAHERRLSEIAEEGTTDHKPLSGGDVVERALEHASRFGQRPEFPTGLSDLDAMLGGLQRGELTILAGRPGSGKTLVGLGVARMMAASGAGILYASLEMSAQALGLRLLCDHQFRLTAYGPTGPTMAGLATGQTVVAGEDLADARDQLAAMPLRLDCRAGLTVTKIEQMARRQFREWKRQGVEPGPLIVDHLGLVRPEKDRQGSRHAEVADISRALAELAKRLNVPVVALCQLNRGVEGREDKRPLLSDLRQAGELEEDARVVLLLHRPAYYHRTRERETFEEEAERLAREDRDRNLLRIIVAKNSNGPTGEVETYVDVSRSAVRDKEVRP